MNLLKITAKSKLLNIAFPTVLYIIAVIIGKSVEKKRKQRNLENLCALCSGLLSCIFSVKPENKLILCSTCSMDIQTKKTIWQVVNTFALTALITCFLALFLGINIISEEAAVMFLALGAILDTLNYVYGKPSEVHYISESELSMKGKKPVTKTMIKADGKIIFPLIILVPILFLFDC